MSSRVGSSSTGSDGRTTLTYDERIEKLKEKVRKLEDEVNRERHMKETAVDKLLKIQEEETKRRHREHAERAEMIRNQTMREKAEYAKQPLQASSKSLGAVQTDQWTNAPTITPSQKVDHQPVFRLDSVEKRQVNDLKLWKQRYDDLKSKSVEREADLLQQLSETKMEVSRKNSTIETLQRRSTRRTRTTSVRHVIPVAKIKISVEATFLLKYKPDISMPVSRSTSSVSQRFTNKLAVNSTKRPTLTFINVLLEIDSNAQEFRLLDERNGTITSWTAAEMLIARGATDNDLKLYRTDLKSSDMVSVSISRHDCCSLNGELIKEDGGSVENVILRTGDNCDRDYLVDALMECTAEPKQAL